MENHVPGKILGPQRELYRLQKSSRLICIEKSLNSSAPPQTSPSLEWSTTVARGGQHLFAPSGRTDHATHNCEDSNSRQSLFGVLKLDVKWSPFQGHSSQWSLPYCQQRTGCRDDSLERGELAFLEEKKEKKRKKRRRNSSGGQGSILPHSPLAALLGCSEDLTCIASTVFVCLIVYHRLFITSLQAEKYSQPFPAVHLAQLTELL